MSKKLSFMVLCCVLGILCKSGKGRSDVMKLFHFVCNFCKCVSFFSLQLSIYMCNCKYISVNVCVALALCELPVFLSIQLITDCHQCNAIIVSSQTCRIREMRITHKIHKGERRRQGECIKVTLFFNLRNKQSVAFHIKLE